MGAAFSVSTSGVAPGERIAFWNAGSARIGGARAEALCDVFDAEVSHRRLGDLCVYRLDSTPHRVTTSALLAGHGRFLRLRYQENGTSLIVRGGRTFQLERGDWIVSDPHMPHVAVNHGPAAHLWLQVPVDTLRPDEVRAVNAGERLRIGRRTDGALREAMAHALAGGDADEDQLSCRLTALMRRALGEARGEFAPEPNREETARRARAFIAANLRDPDLSVEQVARELGCTPRYLHKVFEGSDSVSRTIWNMRLDQCRARLLRAGPEAPTLTALAFDFGFSSSSHFSRSFRDRFGVSPSAVVAAAQQ